MSWESSINAFKSYLKIERSLSDNSILAYIRDVKKFADYAINLELSELKIERKDISNFLVLILKEGAFASHERRWQGDGVDVGVLQSLSHQRDHRASR